MGNEPKVSARASARPLPAKEGGRRVSPRKLRLVQAAYLQKAIFSSRYFSCIATDEKGVIQIFNVGAQRMLGYAADEVINRLTPADLSDRQEQIERGKRLSVEYAKPIAPGFESLVFKASQGIEDIYELTYLRQDGTVLPAMVSVTALRDVENAVIGYLLIGNDITAQKKVSEELLQAASVFTYASEGIFITDVKGSIINVNGAFSRITGYSKEEILGRNPRTFSSAYHDKAFFTALFEAVSKNDSWQGEIWNKRKDGRVYASMQTISVVRDSQGHIRRYMALFSDVTANKEYEKKLEHIAHYDSLTNLPNRVLLSDRLKQAMSQEQRRELVLAVGYIDLDGFKAINDQNGHHVGDKLLIAVASNMKKALREGDTLARIGGDEFVALLLDLTDVPSSLALFSRLLTAAAQPVKVGELNLQVSASLGVTFYPQAEEVDSDLLLRQADQAMYLAKLSGRNRYRVFDVALDQSLRGQHKSMERIRDALKAGEFLLYYQPKVNMKTGQLISVEALIRWQRPDAPLMLPAAFLPEIEDHPLSIALNEWVINAALTQIELWRVDGLDTAVSVNISARPLQQANFLDRLKVILAAHPQVNPNRLELEILETSALQDIEQVSQLIEACARIGVTFSLDDFGTGYSSLTYLKRLKVVALKIDQSFVRDMLEDPDDLAILEGVISLAAAFHRQVVAEGVETVAHGTSLLKLGCYLAQGYGIAPPMPASALLTWSSRWRPEPVWLAMQAA